MTPDEQLPAAYEQPARRGGVLRVLLSPWLAVIVAGLCFINSLPNELVYDDHHQIVNNERIRALTSFRDIWLSDYTQISTEGPKRLNPNRDLMYRPLVDFSFALNYAVHGVWPAGFRLVNVLLHMLVCLLVWRFAQRLFQDAAISSCTALLFAVHPIHCEAVVYVVGRAELLAAAFMLMGLLVLAPRERPASALRTLAAGLLFFAALLAKESAVCYLPVALLVLIHFLRRWRESGSGPGWSWLLGRAVLLLVPLVLYFPLRYVALGGQLARGKPFSMLNPLVNADLVERLFTPLTILGHYTRLLLWPQNLSTGYGLAVVDPAAGPTAMTWLGAAALTLLIGLGGYLRQAGVWRGVALLCGLWWVSYFLISNTVMLFAAMLAERLMYWPSVPILLLVSLAGVGLWRRVGARLPVGLDAQRAVGMTLGLLIVVALGARSLVRNHDWRSGLALFTKDAATHPESAEINANAAVEYFLRSLDTDDAGARRGYLEQADAYYARALSIFPAHWGFLSHHGEILFTLGDLDRAIGQAKLALQLKPGDPMLLAALGRYLRADGRHLEALPHLEEAVRIAPDDLGCLALLGETLLAANQPERAIPVLARVADGNRSNWQVRRLLATTLLTQRDPQGALRYAQEACQLKPGDLGSQLALAEALLATGQRARGLEQFERIRNALPQEHPLRTQVEERIRANAAPPSGPENP